MGLGKVCDTIQWPLYIGFESSFRLCPSVALFAFADHHRGFVIGLRLDGGTCGGMDSELTKAADEVAETGGRCGLHEAEEGREHREAVPG